MNYALTRSITFTTEIIFNFEIKLDNQYLIRYFVWYIEELI